MKRRRCIWQSFETRKKNVAIFCLASTPGRVWASWPTRVEMSFVFYAQYWTFAYFQLVRRFEKWVNLNKNATKIIHNIPDSLPLLLPLRPPALPLRSWKEGNRKTVYPAIIPYFTTISLTWSCRRGLRLPLRCRSQNPSRTYWGLAQRLRWVRGVAAAAWGALWLTWTRGRWPAI